MANNVQFIVVGTKVGFRFSLKHVLILTVYYSVIYLIRHFSCNITKLHLVEIRKILNLDLIFITDKLPICF